MTTPNGDSIISLLPPAGTVNGSEQFIMDQTVSGKTNTVTINSQVLAQQLFQFIPITINGATITGSTFSTGTINSSTIGATTPSTGAFTTLSASSTVSGTGFTNYVTTFLASPTPIGSVTPNTGAFTTLSASSTVSGTGFSTYLASPPAIGGTAAAAGTFTSLNSTSGTLNATSIGATTPGTGAFTTFSSSGEAAFTGIDALQYQCSTSQSIPNNANTIITSWTKVYDQLNTQFNASTGIFTFPATGYYLVSAQVTYASHLQAVQNSYAINISVNGSVVTTGVTFGQAANTNEMSVSVTGVVLGVSGQTMSTPVFQSIGSSLALNGQAANNYVSIVRVA